MLVLVLALSLSGAPAAPAPSAPVPPPAKAEVRKPSHRPSVSSLRLACYGGRGEKLKPGVIAEFDRMAGELMLKNDFARAAHWFKRVLQGGVEDSGTLRRLGMALESSRRPEDLEAAKACGDLIERVYPPLPPPK